ncbi:MAG: hypothetical protein HFJ49_01380 [Clostridia bacterium]|nr:hypothetical protein [Clostridia bacterium]
MQEVSQKCTYLLNNSDELTCFIVSLNSGIIEYGVILEKNPDYKYSDFWHKNISQDLQNIINIWNNKKFSEDLLLLENKNFKQIIPNDSTKYSSQIFFPLFFEEKLDGLAIFFKTKGSFNMDILNKK